MALVEMYIFLETILCACDIQALGVWCTTHRHPKYYFKVVGDVCALYSTSYTTGHLHLR
jgi:hypothetical protein